MVLFSMVKTLVTGEKKIKKFGYSFSVYLLIAMELIWFSFEFFPRYRGVILVNFGIIASLLVCKMIICSTAKMDFEFFHVQLIPCLVSTVALILLELSHYSEISIYVVWGTLLINVFQVIYFIKTTVDQITKALNIYCFSLEKRIKAE